jgi:hypothetical protein
MNALITIELEECLVKLGMNILGKIYIDSNNKILLFVCYIVIILSFMALARQMKRSSRTDGV